MIRYEVIIYWSDEDYHLAMLQRPRSALCYSDESIVI